MTLAQHEQIAADAARRVFGTAAPPPPRAAEAEFWRRREPAPAGTDADADANADAADAGAESGGGGGGGNSTGVRRKKRGSGYTPRRRRGGGAAAAAGGNSGGPLAPPLYGNDVEGTAFSARPGDALAASGWNLAALAFARGSPLRLLPAAARAVPGVTSPMLYVGQFGAAFCFHTEDHWLGSANYHHFGAPKVWYGAPAGDADAFEGAVLATVYAKAAAALRRKRRGGRGGGGRGAAADAAAAAAADADVLRAAHAALLLKSTLVSPGALRARGVRVCRAVQQPGEFVVTLPRAYHGGFSAGFNCGEAVNFMTADCWPFVLQAGARLRRLREPQILPVEQLLAAVGAAELDALEAAAVTVQRPEGSGGGSGGGYASGSSRGVAGAEGPGLALRCLLRLLRWHAARRAELVERCGAEVRWWPVAAPRQQQQQQQGGSGQPASDEASSWPCARCLDPAFFAAVAPRGGAGGDCVCLRCALEEGPATLGGRGGAPRPLLLVRPELRRLEALARALEARIVASAPAAGVPDCGALGPDGLTESARFGADGAADADLRAPFEWPASAWPSGDGAGAAGGVIVGGGGVSGRRLRSATPPAAQGNGSPAPPAKTDRGPQPQPLSSRRLLLRAFEARGGAAAAEASPAPPEVPAAAPAAATIKTFERRRTRSASAAPSPAPPAVPAPLAASQQPRKRSASAAPSPAPAEAPPAALAAAAASPQRRVTRSASAAPPPLPPAPPPPQQQQQRTKDALVHQLQQRQQPPPQQQQKQERLRQRQTAGTAGSPAPAADGGAPARKRARRANP